MWGIIRRLLEKNGLINTGLDSACRTVAKTAECVISLCIAVETLDKRIKALEENQAALTKAYQTF